MEPWVLAMLVLVSAAGRTEYLTVPTRLKQRPAVSLLDKVVELSTPIPMALENPFRQETLCSSGSSIVTVTESCL